jgi:hypothetical protein
MKNRKANLGCFYLLLADIIVLTVLLLLVGADGVEAWIVAQVSIVLAFLLLRGLYLLGVVR